MGNTYRNLILKYSQEPDSAKEFCRYCSNLASTRRYYDYFEIFDQSIFAGLDNWLIVLDDSRANLVSPVSKSPGRLIVHCVRDVC